jgi:hypothetical protein
MTTGIGSPLTKNYSPLETVACWCGPYRCASPAPFEAANFVELAFSRNSETPTPPFEPGFLHSAHFC